MSSIKGKPSHKLKCSLEDIPQKQDKGNYVALTEKKNVKSCQRQIQSFLRFKSEGQTKKLYVNNSVQ